VPEGDTIRSLADRIGQRLTGATVTRSTFRHPKLALADLVGATLASTDAHGKHLLLRWVGGPARTGTTLHVHLRMDGAIRFDRAVEVPEWRRHVELVFDNGGVLTGVDLPVVGLVPTEQESAVLGHLGPDVIGDFDLAETIDRLCADPDRALAAAVLDQTVMAGFGNEYAIEVPFIGGVSPHQPIGSVGQLDQLVILGVDLIRWNASRRGRNTTGRRIERSDTWIASPRQRRCPICGDLVRREPDTATPWRRRTAWCPTCQPVADTVAVDLGRVRELLRLHPIRRNRPCWSAP
jgi:endonuclease-8